MNEFKMMICLTLTIMSMTVVVGQTKEEVVSNVRSKYSVAISDMEGKKLEKEVIHYDCPDDPDFGDISFFTDSSGLRVIEHSFGMGDHYGATHSYYLSEGQLYFFFGEAGSWTFDSRVDYDPENPATIETFEETRKYYGSEGCVKQLEKSYQVRSAAANNPSSSEIPNEEVACTGSTKIKTLLKIWEFKTKIESECIWEDPLVISD